MKKVFPIALSVEGQQQFARLVASIRQHGYAFESASNMRRFLEAFGFEDWGGFSESWERLGLDRYMADGGRYRRRRYATYALEKAHIERKAHQPHYQSRDYNPLNGGVERWFAPIEPVIGAHPVMTAILRAAHLFALELTPSHAQPKIWHAEVHQFRIDTRPDESSNPTPEGMHRDGVDWVFVLMVSRVNITSGVTTIYNDRKQAMGSFTLRSPLDTAFVDDHRMFHGVTAVTPLDPTLPAHRDVLVVTLRHA